MGGAAAPPPARRRRAGTLTPRAPTVALPDAPGGVADEVARTTQQNWARHIATGAAAMPDGPLHTLHRHLPGHLAMNAALLVRNLRPVVQLDKDDLDHATAFRGAVRRVAGMECETWGYSLGTLVWIRSRRLPSEVPRALRALRALPPPASVRDIAPHTRVCLGAAVPHGRPLRARKRLPGALLGAGARRERVVLQAADVRRSLADLRAHAGVARVLQGGRRDGLHHHGDASGKTTPPFSVRRPRAVALTGGPALTTTTTPLTPPAPSPARAPHDSRGDVASPSPSPSSSSSHAAARSRRDGASAAPPRAARTQTASARAAAARRASSASVHVRDGGGDRAQPRAVARRARAASRATSISAGRSARRMVSLYPAPRRRSA